MTNSFQDAQSLPKRLAGALRRRWFRHVSNAGWRGTAAEVAKYAPRKSAPIVLFEASARLSGVSQNNAFQTLLSWSLALQGIEPVHFVCKAGMSRCVLGTSRLDADAPPPCGACYHQSEVLYSHSTCVPFVFQFDPTLEEALRGLNLADLMNFSYEGLPLGELALPGLRWIMRRQHLQDDDFTVGLLRDYIRSAYSLALQFDALLERVQPRAVVVFNGMFYPEATARFVARQRGLRVISHEVGMQPLSAYFTEGDATAYDLKLPADFALNDEQNARLDAYLEKRFKGHFHMAGVQFWPEMHQVDGSLQERIASFRQMVPVFTNVIFDTSQPHANVLFEDMFVWLDTLLQRAGEHPDTLFIIRAHPDEARPGKASEESVQDWALSRGVAQMKNVHFIPPQEFVDSYQLIRMAHFVAVYNSTIGLEASILGARVLSAGKSRYTGSNVVDMPDTRAAYDEMLESFLSAEALPAKPEHSVNARRFLYWQLYRSSLSFEAFLQEDPAQRGYVRLKPFPREQLLPENSPSLATIHDGLLNGGDFMLKEA